MTMPNETRAALVVTGGESAVSELEQFLPFTVTDKWREGDSIQGTLLRRKENGWRFSLSARHDLDISEAVAELVAFLRPHAAALRSTVEGGESRLVLRCSVYMAEGNPTIYLEPDLIQAIADLGCALDVDIVAVADSEPDEPESLAGSSS